MGKEKGSPLGGFVSELFRFGVYKASQGKITRQVTFATLAVTFFLGAWKLYYTLRMKIPDEQASLVYVIAGAVLALGLWLSYRAVNFPSFADFLIAVEAEMNKVSWPTRGELIRSSIVVIFVILGLAALLFGYDFFWKAVFVALGVLKGGAGADAGI